MTNIQRTQTHDEIRALLIQGLSAAEIVTRVGCRDDDVYNERRRTIMAGIEVPNHNVLRAKQARERWQKFADIARTGLTMQEIQAAMGISSSAAGALFTRCKQNGLLPSGFKIEGSGLKGEKKDDAEPLAKPPPCLRYEDDPRAVRECAGFDYTAAKRFGMSAYAKAAEARLSYGVGSRMAAGD